jgi:hypothetical protein
MLRPSHIVTPTTIGIHDLLGTNATKRVYAVTTDRREQFKTKIRGQSVCPRQPLLGPIKRPSEGRSGAGKSWSAIT